MKKIIALFFMSFFLCLSAAQAQGTTYRNEWIDYNKTYYKIKITKNGLVHIPTAALSANGIPVNGAALKMYHHGVEIPLFATTDGPMGANDYVAFIGQKNDGTLDRDLFPNPQWQLTTANSLFTDTSAYFLTWDLSANNARFQTINNDLGGNLPPKEAFYRHKTTLYYQETFSPGEPFHNLGNVNNFYADFENGEGWVSSLILEDSTMNRSIPTPSAYTAGGGVAQFETRVCGRSDNYFRIPDHHTRISFNGTVVKDSTYEGYISPIFKFSVPIDNLTANTTITYKSVADLLPPPPLPQNRIDKLSIANLSVLYPRTFDFNNDKSRQFEVDNNGDKYFEIVNFNGGTTPILYDLSNRLRLIPFLDNSSGANVYKFFLPQVPGGAAKRTLFISNTFDTSVLTTITSDMLQQRQFTNYGSADNQGNYLIISHPKLTTADTNYVAQYAQYRQTAQGGGYQPIVADIEELYDQFAWGISKHPLAVRNYVNYAIDQWDIEPKLLFLMGKSITYQKIKYSIADYRDCLIPTYGITPSDAMLAVRANGSYRPQIGVGRLPALQGYQIGNYLDKIKQYEVEPTCSKADNLWRKHALHLSGSSNIVEMNDFVDVLENSRLIYENDSLFGGKVVRTFQRANPSFDPTEIPEIDPYINEGQNIIYYMGHSSLDGWTIDVKTPQDYTNFGKYPFILSSSCYVGNIHESSSILSMPEEWVFAPNRGAIGMLAGVGFGFVPYMKLYTNTLYANFCKDHYNQPLGYSIQRAITETDSLSYTPGFQIGRDGVKLTAQEFTLTGDPALVLNAYDSPDFVIEYSETGVSDVSLIPSSILTSTDSFAVKIALVNLGKWTGDSITIRIDRQFPNGTNQLAALQRIIPPAYSDTLLLYVQTGGNDAAGDNEFTVTIDADQEVSEKCEANNIVTFKTFIFSDLLLPIAPCDFSIVTAPQVTLYASTGFPQAISLPYQLEIDTTELFNSPLRQFKVLNSEGGVIKWTVETALEPNRVYYWRASQIPVIGGNYNWQYSSFIHLPTASKGWNQSHYYQYQKDSYDDLSLQSDRQFSFTKFLHHISCSNDQNGAGSVFLRLDALQQLTDNSVLFNCGNGGGITLVIFSEQYNAMTNMVDLVPMISVLEDLTETGCNRRGVHGNIQGNALEVPAFEFGTHTAEQLDALVNFINNLIPVGSYIAAYSVANHNLNNPNGNDVINTGGYMPALQAFFASIGAPQVNGLTPNQPFIVFGKKGDSSFATQFVTPSDPFATFTLDVDVETRLGEGIMTSTRIGPSSDWGNITWAYDGIEPTVTADNTTLTVIGIRPDGSETDLFSTLQTPTVDLSSVDAAVYPRLRLRLHGQDTVFRTPAQLQHWRVLYQPAGELAIDQQQHFVFQSDTVQEGQPIHLEVALLNASGTAMDSVLVGYTVYNLDNNTTHVINYPRQAPVGAWQSIIAQATFGTTGMAGNNLLLIDVNPNGDQLEKFRFNNVLQIPFFVISDHINPILDVTFDGRHILNGDLVSANPSIQIRAKDENRYLALNDTADISIKIAYPDGTEMPITWNNPIVTFTPATTNEASNGNNTAQVILNPDFTIAGIYELIVSARDRSDNQFDANKYRVAFEVDPTPKVSNVLNYPNPFTSSTRFLFTLSGSKVPERFNIQIMTVGGRVVRELSQAELGSLYIGRNMTEFAWDGTDQFGNPLANGLYLYRVVAYIDGRAVEFRANDAIDSYFENGIGKMYLMR